MTYHVMERVAEGDRTVWACTCGKFLHPNLTRAYAMYDDHLAEDVTPSPLSELALIEAKQRHPSRQST